MYDEYGRWHDVYWHDDYWHHLGGLFDVIILLLVIGGIVYLVQFFARSSTEGPKKQDSALDTLRRRYASGEINEEEFAQKKKELGF